MSFLNKISLRTKTMILATATPIQLDPAEAWHLLYVLAGGDACKDRNWTIGKQKMIDLMLAKGS